MYEFNKLNNNKKEIEKYAKENNLKIKWINQILYVTSVCDEWFIEPQKNSYYLYHMFKSKVNVSGKYHKQKGYYLSYIKALECIKEHDNCILYHKGVDNNLEKLFKQI